MTKLTPEQVQQYNDDGYIVLKGMLSPEEIGLLSRTAHEDRVLDQHSFGKADGEGGTVRLSLWNHPTDTIYGMIARSESIVGVAEQVLGGEVYHYHSKMIMKDAKVGGAWAWHQDYGYWYQNGVLFPLLTSAFIAVDPATRGGGCMQVIQGSHNLGRIEHTLTGDQAGADMARVDEILKVLPLVYVEMAPGDVLYFHAQPVASFRSEQLRQPALVDDLLLQRRPQQPVQGSPSPALHPAAQGPRLRHPRRRQQALRRLRRERLARHQRGQQRQVAKEHMRLCA